MTLFLLSLLACPTPPDTGDTDDTGTVDTTPGELVASDQVRDLDPDVSDDTVAARAADDLAFAMDLHHQLVDGDENLFWSPHSVSVALAMTWAGTAGDTASQLATALHFNDPAETVHAGFNALALALDARSQIQVEGDNEPPALAVINALWGQAGYPFQAHFLDVLGINYGAGMHLLDFKTDPDGSRQAINGWVEDQTNDRILALLPDGSITTDTKLVLTNAIWFKASWSAPFEASETSDDPFTLLDGGTIDVATMHGQQETPYGSGDGWQAVDLPYVGEQLVMTVVLPDAGRFNEIEAGLDGPGMVTLLGGLDTHDVTLAVPKFGFRSGLDLVSPLKALGVVDAFDSNLADFSAMSTASDLYVTGVFHQGFVAVDEQGTEAAAATAVVIGDDSAPPKATLTADRPFLVLIRDRPTGAVLFLGRVVDPSQG